MRKRIEALVGSTLREIGILVVVFAPLEGLLRGPTPRLSYLLSAAGGSLFLIVVGIILGVRAEQTK